MMTPGTASARLCIVTPSHSGTRAGGAEYQIERLVDVLREKGHRQIYYLSSAVEAGSKSDRYHLMRIGRGSHAPRLGYLCHSAPLYKLLRQINPKTIYQRVACGYTGICAYYARRHGARLVWHIAHDSDVSPGVSIDGRNPLRRFLEKRSVEYGIRRASCIVAQTSDQAELLERNYHRRADAIIPNFHPAPSERIDKSGDPAVAWVASVKPWKQPEAFVDLARELRDLKSVRFVIVGGESTGSGDRTWLADLRRRIQEAGNIDYRGACSQQEVNELLAKSRVFVNTSRYEGFPNTFIQAWMREAAVVSLHVDPDRLLRERGLGLFCDGSVQKLAAAVRTLVSDENLRREYVQRAREYAFAHHSMTNADSLARLIEADATRQ